MSHCVQGCVTRCLRKKLSWVRPVYSVRNIHGRAIKEDVTENQPLLNLEEVHKEWKTAGYFPRAPAEVSSHGAQSLKTLLLHNHVTRHVFNGKSYKLFPLIAHFKGKEVDFGGILAPKHALSAPLVTWEKDNLSPDKKYTLVMVSPDCTSSNIHWCVRDIPPTPLPSDFASASDATRSPHNTETNTRETVSTASDLTASDLTASDPPESSKSESSNATTLVEYLPPVPLKGTGFYRYVLVLLEQTSTAPAAVARTDTLPGLVAEQGLVPVGAAMFQACWDPSVGHSLAAHLGVDEKQFVVQRTKNNLEHQAEELFLRKEWEMKTGFM